MIVNRFLGMKYRTMCFYISYNLKNYISYNLKNLGQKEVNEYVVKPLRQRIGISKTNFDKMKGLSPLTSTKSTSTNGYLLMTVSYIPCRQEDRCFSLGFPKKVLLLYYPIGVIFTFNLWFESLTFVPYGPLREHTCLVYMTKPFSTRFSLLTTSLSYP